MKKSNAKRVTTSEKQFENGQTTSCTQHKIKFEEFEQQLSRLSIAINKCSEGNNTINCLHGNFRLNVQDNSKDNLSCVKAELEALQKHIHLKEEHVQVLEEYSKNDISVLEELIEREEGMFSKRETLKNNYTVISKELNKVLRERVMHASMRHKITTMTYGNKLNVLYSNYNNLINISKDVIFKKQAAEFCKSIEQYYKYMYKYVLLHKNIHQEIVSAHNEAMIADEYTKKCLNYLAELKKPIERVNLEPPMPDRDTMITLVERQLKVPNDIFAARINKIMSIVRIKMPSAKREQLTQYLMDAAGNDKIDSMLNEHTDDQLSELFLCQYL